MEALQTTSNPAPAGEHRWLDLEQAARLANQSLGHLRRKCGEVWMAEGRAKLLQESGQKARWQVRDDADPSFGSPTAVLAVLSPVPLAAVDLRSTPKPLVDKAAQKLRIVRAWEMRLATDSALGIERDLTTARYLADLAGAGTQISRRTLYHWARKFRTDNGLSGLIDGRCRRPQARQSQRAGDPFFSYLKAQYLDQRRRSVALCYDRAVDKAQELQWQIVSESEARRYLKSLPAPEVVLYREGAKAFTDKIEPVITGDYSQLASNDIWNSDHMEFDVLVQTGERVDAPTGEVRPIFSRPWLSSWMDLASRKIVGYVIRAQDPDTEAIVEAFYRGISVNHGDHGVPVEAYTDNGRDYDSRAFTGLSKSERIQRQMWRRRKVHVEHDQERLGGIYAALGVKHMHAWKYHGQSKPIERFHGTVHARFDREWDTYCGRDPLFKPEDLKDHLKAGHAPTFEEFCEVFAVWLQQDYHGRIHTGESMDTTPAAAWEARLQVKRTCPEEQLAIFCRPRIGPFTVSQEGLRVNGLRYAGHGELAHWIGRQVWVRTSSALDTVSVWDERDQAISTVAITDLVPRGATPAQQKEAIREKRSDIKAIKAAIAPRLRVHESTADRIRRIRASVPPLADAPTPPTPLTYQAVRPDLAAQAQALQVLAQRPLRKAVGSVEGIRGIDLDFVAATDGMELAPSASRVGGRQTPSLLQLVGED